MTAGRFDAADHARRMRVGGFWRDTPYDERLVHALEAAPEKPALVAYRADRADREQPRRFSYRELGDRVARCAASLRGLGAGAGDIVAVQLPNWWEFVVVSLAAEDSVFKRPFFLPHGTPNTAPDACESVFVGG